MKNIILILVIFASMSLGLAGCSHSHKNINATEQTGNEKTIYTCPMHPEIIRDKPGKCPKCGMALVEKKVTPHDTMHNMSADSMQHMKNM